MSQDSNSGGDNFNSRPNSVISQGFNRDNELGAQIAALSPQGQQTVRDFQTVAATRLELEAKSQKRFHEFRVQRAYIDLLENYARDTTERPPEIKADPSPDFRVLREQAERTVTDREAFHLNRILQERDANIRQIIAQGPLQPTRSERDHEPERE